MEITREVRDYAARLNEAAVELAEETTQVDPASDPHPASALALERQARAGMDEMSQKFRELGGEVYVAAGSTKSTKT
jgi:phosphomethylpyrimidine synthase